MGLTAAAPSSVERVTGNLVITLDTSCVSALANPQDSNDQDEIPALDALVDLARQDEIVLQLTSAYERDFERYGDDDARSQRLQWLATAPPIQRVGGVFRLDVSVLNGPDVLGGESDVQLDQQLRQILRPSLAHPGEIPGYEDDPRAAAKLFSDIDHLIAHFPSGAQWFVTLDAKTILKRHDALKGIGIEVRRPSSALAELQ
jgi:hypothetical protein